MSHILFYLNFWLSWVFVAVRRLCCLAACGILAPQAEIEPMSPVLEGRFLTTGPPGKSCLYFIFIGEDLFRLKWTKGTVRGQLHSVS